MATQLRETGTIARLNEERGFAFVRPSDGSADVFAHCSEFPKRHEFDATMIGREISFTRSISERTGKPEAANIQFAG